MSSYGRRKITTGASEITKDNVVAEVLAAYEKHSVNRSEIVKLDEYFRGKTDILNKVKEVRESINHKTNENRAYEIVNFHKGYTFGEPVQYVRRENSSAASDDDAIAADINALNGYMADADKAGCDNVLAEWMYVAGTGYRLALPNEAWEKDGDEPPFKIAVLDPRNTFVVYSNKVGNGNTPVFGVTYVENEDNERVYGVYTDAAYFEFAEGGEVAEAPHALGMEPVIEYPANNSRLGVFEVAMALLDALNELQSNRMDDIVQFVNSILAILGADIDEERRKQLEAWKMMCLPVGADAKYLSANLSQADAQTLKNDLYQSILTICGMPNRNGGSSTSDTGSAVILRDGWQDAEARAKATETVFKSSEKEFLKLILRILRDTTGTALRLADIETHFTRRNYENIAAKSQVLIAMLNNPNIHPELAFSSCGMFVDPESAYLQSLAWREQNEKKEEEKAQRYVESLTHDADEGGDEDAV